jgi:hypothetical protein
MSRFAPVFPMLFPAMRTARVLETVGLVLTTAARLFGIWI